MADERLAHPLGMRCLDCRLGPGRRSRTLLCVLVLCASACAQPEPDPQRGEDPPDPAAGTVHEFAHLEDEVRRLLAFLQGDASLPGGALAESVTLYIAPEGGGESRTVAGRELRSRADWRVGSRSLVPPAGPWDARLTPGLHSNCMPVALEALYPELARHPHVGVRLAKGEHESCLQTWNATFVFTGDAAAPRLSAVVYDQWEW